MANNIQRSQIVLREVEKLSESERTLALLLYLQILGVELFHWSWPNFCGMLSIVVTSLIAITTNFRIPLSGFSEMVGVAIICLLSYLFSFLLSKILVFNRLRDRALHEIKNLQINNSDFSKVLTFLKDRDPRIEANIGKLLP